MKVQHLFRRKKIITAKAKQVIPDTIATGFYGTRIGIEGYTGYIYECSNGVVTKSFRNGDNAYDFINSGDGTNKITKFHGQMPNTDDFVSEIGAEPSLFKEADGTFSADFSLPRTRLILPNDLTGNIISIVANADMDNSYVILGRSNRYLFLGQNSGYSQTSFSSSFCYYLNNIPILSRADMYNAIHNKYGLVHCRNINLSSLAGGEFGGLNGGSSANPNAFNFNGRFKEIATLNSSLDEEIDSFIQNQITINQL